MKKLIEAIFESTNDMVKWVNKFEIPQEDIIKFDERNDSIYLYADEELTNDIKKRNRKIRKEIRQINKESMIIFFTLMGLGAIFIAIMILRK